MFVLVLFEDGVHYVCSEKRVMNVQGVECTVKYSNGGRYPARILHRNSDQDNLKALKKELDETGRVDNNNLTEKTENEEHAIDSSVMRNPCQSNENFENSSAKQICVVETPARGTDNGSRLKNLHNLDDPDEIMFGENSTCDGRNESDTAEALRQKTNNEEDGKNMLNKAVTAKQNNKENAADSLIFLDNSQNIENANISPVKPICTVESPARKTDDEKSQKNMHGLNDLSESHRSSNYDNKQSLPLVPTDVEITSGLELSFGSSNDSLAPPSFNSLITNSVLKNWLDENVPNESAKIISDTLERPLDNASVCARQVSQCDEANSCSSISITPSNQNTEIAVQPDLTITEAGILKALKQPFLFSTPNETAVDSADDVHNSYLEDANTTNTSDDANHRVVARVLHSNIVDKTQSQVCTFDETSYCSDDQRNNESDYVPSSVHSDDSKEDESINENDANESSSKKRGSNRKSNQDSSLEVSFSVNAPGKSTRDDADMYVTTASAQKGLDRRSYCMYCQTMQTKFARHLENKHKDIKEVKKFSDLPKNNPERLKIIDTIRKYCMFSFNTNNAINDGELMVVRRPSSNVPRTAKDFKVCHKCKGFFTKNNIRHHAKRCFGFNGEKQRSLLVLGRQILGRIHSDASDILRKEIFPVLREDDIVRLIRYDRLIILYGNKLCAKYGNLQHQHDMIRAHLRLLGRFLTAVKAINNEVTDFASIYQPRHYDDTVRAINEIAGYDSKTKSYRSPSTAYSIGSLLKKIANFYIFDCIKMENNEQKSKTEDFLKLLTEDIGISVNKGVIESQTAQKRQKKVELPSVKDIRTLHNYLRTERTSAYRALENGFDLSEWLKLAQTTLISVQLFNRRRAGEIERVFIDDFKNYEGIKEDELKKMTEKSKEIASNYVRFTIRGKLNRTVPVLLTLDLLRCIEKILQYRADAKVQPTNQYIFGIPGRSTTRHLYLRACALMRKFAKDSGVDFPHKLTGTTLRKHIATNCINLNLSENEVADVAKFMGHAEKIHHEHYRQPIVSREIMRISKVLVLAQGGNDDDDDDDDDDDNDDDDDGDDGDKYVDDDEKTECRTGKKGKRTVCKTNTEKLVKLRAKSAKTSTRKRPDVQKMGKTAGRRETNNDSSFDVSDSESDVPKRKKQKKRSTSPYGPVGSKKRWSVEDKELVKELFEPYLKRRTLPSLEKIKKTCANYPTLQARKPAIIKTWISNQYKK